MSTTTVRANARTLPETTSRGAILGAVLAACAIGAIPIAAEAASAGGPAGPDAELFALIAEAREANARYEAASDAAEEAWKRTEKVPAPIVTEEDARMWKLKAGDPFDVAHLDLMRRRQAHRQKLKYLKPFVAIAADAPYVATLSEEDRAVVEMMTATEVREAQLVAARDEWNEACRVAKDRSGETAAEEWAEQLFNEKYDACERVASKRALTMRGLLAKLAFIAGDFDADEELPAEMGTSEKILFSVAVDFKALQAAGS